MFGFGKFTFGDLNMATIFSYQEIILSSQENKYTYLFNISLYKMLYFAVLNVYILGKGLSV